MITMQAMIAINDRQEIASLAWLDSTLATFFTQTRFLSFAGIFHHCHHCENHHRPLDSRPPHRYIATFSPIHCHHHLHQNHHSNIKIFTIDTINSINYKSFFFAGKDSKLATGLSTFDLSCLFSFHLSPPTLPLASSPLAYNVVNICLVQCHFMQCAMFIVYCSHKNIF